MLHIKIFFQTIQELIVTTFTFCIISVGSLVISHICELSTYSEFNY